MMFIACSNEEYEKLKEAINLQTQQFLEGLEREAVQSQKPAQKPSEPTTQPQEATNNLLQLLLKQAQNPDPEKLLQKLLSS